MRRILIHVGAHKTASTLLQRICESKTAELKQLSALYDLGAEDLALLLREKSPLAPWQLEYARAKFGQKYNAIPDESVTVVLSNEIFFGHYNNGYARIGPIAHDLHHIFQDFFVQIAAYVRRQDTFLESAYHQEIKNGGSCTFEEFTVEYDMYAFKWDALLEHYRDQFGGDNLYVFPYEDIVYNNSQRFFANFFDLIGIEFSMERIPVINPSLSKTGLEILRQCNPFLTFKESRDLRDLLLTKFYKRPDEGFGLFSDAERAQLLEYYRESNHNLFENYIVGYDPGYYLGADSWGNSG